MRPHNVLRLITAIAISEGAGILGSLVTVQAIPTWYANLAKPELAPPNWIFGPVWTTLFALLGVALFLVWKNKWKVKNPVLSQKGKAWNPLSERLWSGDLQKQNIIALFWIQLALNVLWSIFFFGLHMPGLAFFELVALWVSVLYLAINFYRVSRTAAWLLLPYLLWVAFAGYLNFAIWVLN